MTKRNDNQAGSVPFNPSSFSLSDFKKWMHGQHREKPMGEELVGCEVEPKIGLRKLLMKMESEEDDIYTLARDFRRKGGTVTEVDGQNLLIEVTSGAFVISRSYVRSR